MFDQESPQGPAGIRALATAQGIGSFPLYPSILIIKQFNDPARQGKVSSQEGRAQSQGITPDSFVGIIHARTDISGCKTVQAGKNAQGLGTGSRMHASLQDIP